MTKRRARISDCRLPDLVARDEAAELADDPDPEPLESFLAVDRGDRFDRLRDMVLGGGEIDRGATGATPNGPPVRMRMGVALPAASSDFDGTQP